MQNKNSPAESKKAVSIQTLFPPGSQKSHSGGRTTVMVLAEDFVCMDIIIKGRVFTGFSQDCVIAEGLIYMGIAIRGKISTGARITRCFVSY